MDGMGGAHASHRRRTTERTCTSYRSTRSESASFSCHSSTVCPMISSPSRFGSPRNGLDLQSRLFCLRRVGLMRPSSGLGTDLSVLCARIVVGVATGVHVAFLFSHVATFRAMQHARPSLIWSWTKFDVLPCARMLGDSMLSCLQSAILPR